MAKRLYTNSKIIVPDPYVVRIDHEFTAEDSSAFLRFPKLARERVFGTWGHTKPVTETVMLKDNPAPAGSIQSLFQNNVEFRVRSYWFFEDKMDATAFRLSIGEKALHVHMWPQTLKFTVYEVVDEESPPNPYNEP
jgi:hypothetical protein